MSLKFDDEGRVIQPEAGDTDEAAEAALLRLDAPQKNIEVKLFQRTPMHRLAGLLPQLQRQPMLRRQLLASDAEREVSDRRKAKNRRRNRTARQSRKRNR